jgi:hypothetical protein
MGLRNGQKLYEAGESSFLCLIILLFLLLQFRGAARRELLFLVILDKIPKTQNSQYCSNRPFHLNKIKYLFHYIY